MGEMNDGLGFPWDFPWLGVMSDNWVSIAIALLVGMVVVDGCRIRRLETKMPIHMQESTK